MRDRGEGLFLDKEPRAEITVETKSHVMLFKFSFHAIYPSKRLVVRNQLPKCRGGMKCVVRPANMCQKDC